MLYVDGMNGVIKHNETIQWLYSLTASKVGAPNTEKLTFTPTVFLMTDPDTVLGLGSLSHGGLFPLGPTVTFTKVCD